MTAFDHLVFFRLVGVVRVLHPGSKSMGARHLNSVD